MYCNLMTVIFAHIFCRVFSVSINGFLITNKFDYSTVPSEILLHIQSLKLVKVK